MHTNHPLTLTSTLWTWMSILNCTPVRSPCMPSRAMVFFPSARRIMLIGTYPQCKLTVNLHYSRVYTHSRYIYHLPAHIHLDCTHIYTQAPKSIHYRYIDESLSSWHVHHSDALFENRLVLKLQIYNRHKIPLQIEQYIEALNLNYTESKNELLSLRKPGALPYGDPSSARVSLHLVCATTVHADVFIAVVNKEGEGKKNAKEKRKLRMVRKMRRKRRLRRVKYRRRKRKLRRVKYWRRKRKLRRV